MHPYVWRAPEVHEGKDQCWFQGPPGAGQHGMGQPSAVDEKTDDGGYFRNFWLLPLHRWLGCVLLSGGHTLPYLGWVPGSQWKPSPPLLFSAMYTLKRNNYLLSGVRQLGPCHLYLPCFPQNSVTGCFNYLFIGLLEEIPLVMRQFNKKPQDNGFSTCTFQTSLQMEVKELWKRGS